MTLISLNYGQTGKTVKALAYRASDGAIAPAYTTYWNGSGTLVDNGTLGALLAAATEQPSGSGDYSASITTDGSEHASVWWDAANGTPTVSNALPTTGGTVGLATLANQTSQGTAALATSAQAATIISDIGALPAAVWNYVTSALGSVSTIGGYIYSTLASILAKLSGGGVTVVVASPVSIRGNISITQGDAYDSTTAQQIQFRDNGTWPVMTNGGGVQLTSVEVKCSISALTNLSTPVLSVACVVTGTSPNQVISVPLTAAQTLSLPVGDQYAHGIISDINKPTNTEIRTLVTGNVTVAPPIPVTW